MTLALILEIIATAAAAAKPFLTPGAPADIAAAAQLLIGIVEKANQAHIEVTGQPINLDLLQPIDPVV